MSALAWVGLFWFATLMCGWNIHLKDYGWGAVNALIALQALAYLVMGGIA